LRVSIEKIQSLGKRPMAGWSTTQFAGLRQRPEAASTRPPPSSLQASMLSASTSVEPASAVTGMAAVVRPASQASTWARPRYHSHRQKTLADSAYQLPMSQIERGTAAMSNGMSRQTRGAGKASPTTLAPSASRSGR